MTKKTRHLLKTTIKQCNKQKLKVQVLKLFNFICLFSAGAPTQPEDVTLAQDSEGWYLKWKKPLDNGGLPLLTYSIEYRLVLFLRVQEVIYFV